MAVAHAYLEEQKGAFKKEITERPMDPAVPVLGLVVRSAHLHCQSAADRSPRDLQCPLSWIILFSKDPIAD